MRSTVIIKPNLIKRDYVQIDHNLILFCDKVGLGLYFSVRTEKYEKSRLRGDSMSPLKNLLSQKGGIPFETLAKRIFSLDFKSEHASLRFVHLVRWQSTGRDFTHLKSNCAPCPWGRPDLFGADDAHRSLLVGLTEGIVLEDLTENIV